MSNWYEVFDNEDVHLMARRQAAALSAVGMGLFSGSAMLLLFGEQLGLDAWHIVQLIFGASIVSALWMMHRLHQVRQIMWCIKLSARSIVGYDYARRKTQFDWLDVRGIELTNHALRIEAGIHQRLDVPHLFPDFAALSHRIMYYAEVYDIPVLVDGQPWESIDVYEVFSCLKQDAAAS